MSIITKVVELEADSTSRRDGHTDYRRKTALFTLVINFRWKYADILAKGQFNNAIDTLFQVSLKE